jgi:hypothetical protein
MKHKEPYKELSWWDCKHKFSTELREYVEQEIKYRKEKEEEQKLKALLEKYSIGSFVEYLGIKMKIIGNIHCINNGTYLQRGFGLTVEWADKFDVIHSKQFNEYQLDQITIIDKETIK